MHSKKRSILHNCYSEWPVLSVSSLQDGHLLDRHYVSFLERDVL